MQGSECIWYLDVRGQSSAYVVDEYVVFQLVLEQGKNCTGGDVRPRRCIVERTLAVCPGGEWGNKGT